MLATVGQMLLILNFPSMLLPKQHKYLGRDCRFDGGSCDGQIAAVGLVADPVVRSWPCWNGDTGTGRCRRPIGMVPSTG